MLNILAVLGGFAAFGALLASGWINLPIRSGYLGAILLVGAAVLARKHWQKRAATVGDDPSGAERNAWLFMAGSALICAFVMVVLATPGSEVHRSTGDTGGAESWMMAIGGAIAWGILYDGKAPRDERDRVIDHRAQKAGYMALVVLLLVFLLLLGFMPRPGMARFTHWLIANTLLLLVMLSGLVQYVVQLAHYVNDRRNSGIANG